MKTIETIYYATALAFALYSILFFGTILFENMKLKSLYKKCKHQKTIIKVIETTTTCETTVEVCMYCNKKLTQPKTDCR